MIWNLMQFGDPEFYLNITPRFSVVEVVAFNCFIEIFIPKIRKIPSLRFFFEMHCFGRVFQVVLSGVAMDEAAGKWTNFEACCGWFRNPKQPSVGCIKPCK